jgi:multiple sugar transport system ATP-binding protein
VEAEVADVQLSGVTKRFGRTTAVRDLDLTVKDGELVVLLGPTGAGKTTTLRLIAGLEPPDEGRITINGRDATRLPPAARDVAFVFQQYSLYPHYTAFENLAFPLRAPGRGWSEEQIRTRIEEIAALLRIEGKLANRATQLSGGEMQRVAIGRALVRQPAIFLMDEPLSSLDAKLREDLRVELKRIQLDLGATILYVTHDQIEAMTLADRIGVLAEGVLVQLGTPRAVYETPANVYVARRLGSPQINLLPKGALGVRDGPDRAASLGIRPEDVIVGQGGEAAEVRAVEHLGAETIALLAAPGGEVHTLLDSGIELHPGDRTTAKARPGVVLFFDATGALIDHPASRLGEPRKERAYGS